MDVRAEIIALRQVLKSYEVLYNTMARSDKHRNPEYARIWSEVKELRSQLRRLEKDLLAGN
jgi:hypothetical protein